MKNLQDKLNKIRKPFYTWSVKFYNDKFPSWLQNNDKNSALLFIEGLENYISDEGEIKEGVKSMFSILDRLFLRCINLINFNIKYYDSENVKDLKFNLYENFIQERFYNNLINNINVLYRLDYKVYCYHRTGRKTLPKPLYFSQFPTLQSICIFNIRTNLAKILNLIKYQYNYWIVFQPLLDIESYNDSYQEYYVEWNKKLKYKLDKLSEILPIYLRQGLKLPTLKPDFHNNTLKLK
tara:strand:+ start:944 stop:1654 length:711 start_codon:yes stop_codon:yes gene_type:complete